MSYLHYFIIALAITIIIIYHKDLKLIFVSLFSLMILFILLNPKPALMGVVEGSKIFFYKVFPSLFIFSILCNSILLLDGISLYNKAIGNILCKPLRLSKNCSFALIVSMLCGYPLGAKFSCDLYGNGYISKEECQRLISIASSSSPLFIVGTIGTSMLNNTYISYLLLLCNILSCFFISIFIKNDNDKTFLCKKSLNLNKQNNNVLKTAIENSISTCSYVGGFVIFFYTINSLLLESNLFLKFIELINKLLPLSPNLIKGFLMGILEITNGCNLISSSSENLILKCSLISFLLAFSGISIIMQCNSFISSYGLKTKLYIKRKLFQGIIASLLCFLFMKLMTLFPFSKQSFFSAIFKSNVSFCFYMIILICSLIIPMFLSLLKKLIHIS